jgi:hypothetical protein
MCYEKYLRSFFICLYRFVFEKGNSFHPTDVLNRGVGGNELTIISWAEGIG